MKHHLAVYTGSFDPITLGHLDVLERSRGMFSEIVLAIGHNPSKPALFSFEERLDLARACVADLMKSAPGGAPVRVETYSGLTVDFARSVGAVAIIRGIYGAECEPEPEFRTVPTFATAGECRAWAARAGAGTVCTNPERPSFRQFYTTLAGWPQVQRMLLDPLAVYRATPTSGAASAWRAAVGSPPSPPASATSSCST